MTQNSINTLNPVVQFLTTTTASVITCNDNFPVNVDAIPLQTDGIEVLTLAITPTKTTSILRINFICFATNAGASNTVVALFQDATVNALGAVRIKMETNSSGNLVINYSMTAGTTSSTTFKARVGSSLAYINGDAVGNRLYGGVALARLTITEFLN